MLSLVLADTAIIDMIAIARISAAIVPNSGITNEPIISISSAPSGKEIVKVLSVEVDVSSNSTSSPSISTKNSSSTPSASNESINSLGKVMVNTPSLVVSIAIINEFASSSGVTLSTLPPGNATEERPGDLLPREALGEVEGAGTLPALELAQVGVELDDLGVRFGDGVHAIDLVAGMIPRHVCGHEGVVSNCGQVGGERSNGSAPCRSAVERRYQRARGQQPPPGRVVAVARTRLLGSTCRRRRWNRPHPDTTGQNRH